VDSKAECGLLNLAHVAINKKVLNGSSIQVKIREGNPEGTRKTMEEPWICKRDEF